MEIKKHLYTAEQKQKWWGEGEWVNEPDIVSFEHNGIECKILRIAAREPVQEEFVFGGHMCGYCKIPKQHPFYGKDLIGNEDIEIDMHGGITYSQKNSEYIPELSEGHWIGFDCGHSHDVIPSMQFLRKLFKSPIEDFEKEMKDKYPNCGLFNPTYKNIEFCIQECKSVADQLKNGINDGL